MAETISKSTTKDDKINFHIQKITVAIEKIQYSEEEERCIRFFKKLLKYN